MKNLIFSILATIGLATTLMAQTPAMDQLASAVTEANSIKLRVTEAKKSVNALTKQLLLPGVPSPAGFETAILNSQNQILDNTDNVSYHLNNALALSGNGFTAVKINQLNTQIVNQIDVVTAIRIQVVNALLANNKTLAQQLLPTLTTNLNKETTLANQLITQLNKAIETIRPYQVCVRTVNSAGVPVAASDLFGFYCYNTTTNEYFYPSNQEGTCLTLPAGTYTFDSFDGYFSGTGSTTITLKKSLVQPDGTITVDLVYWSE